MSQRVEPADSLDDFPTPRWATRALVEHVLNEYELGAASCWEPTCGRGFMAVTLAETFASVRSSDISPYGYGAQLDFLEVPSDSTDAANRPDWIVTNPPFRLAEEFARRAVALARVGAAMLVRTNFIEGAGRYERLFRDCPPAIFAQFVERVPILRGRVDATASTATGYCWLVWLKRTKVQPSLVWIPPCRKRLEKLGDYEDPRHYQADSQI